ncbi:MAG: MaoC/PaaZ C-terminal domain-containing protein [Halobacteria archaeon]
MGLYFEEVEVGTKFATPARTVTDSDVMTFARLTGDNHPLHTDEAYAKRFFPGRIAHGLLNLSLSSGLKVNQATFRDSLIAFLGMESVRFLKPVLIGDSLHVETEVVEKRETSKPDRGVITTKSLTRNQRGEVVLEEVSKLLVARKPAGKKP